MMIGGSKSKTAFMDGYFEKKFDRIMEVKNNTPAGKWVGGHWQSGYRVNVDMQSLTRGWFFQAMPLAVRMSLQLV